MSAAINAFSIDGIRIRIDRSWFIAFVLFACTLSAGYFPLQAPDYSRYAYLFAGILSSLALFSCVLVHELSHCLVARRLGVETRQITLFIFGGVSEMAQTHSSPKSEFLTSIAGPLSSLGLGLGFMAAALAMKGSAARLTSEIVQYICYANFLLAAFNLMPAFPLDGGRVLRSYLWYRSGELRRATESAARGGEVFAMLLVGLGSAGVLMMHVIPGIWLILIGMFLKNSAVNEYRSCELRFGLEDIKLKRDVAA